jgi:malic enzyme
MPKGGKIEVVAKLPLKTRDDLSIAYIPGIGRDSMKEIASNASPPATDRRAGVLVDFIPRPHLEVMLLPTRSTS